MNTGIRLDKSRLDRKIGWTVLSLIVLIGLGLRFVWMITETPVISHEGAEYVRMAENLAQGHGLIGNFEGPETMYTPLFSVLTVSMMLIVRNAETAAHLVALLFGTALIVIVFFIARLIYGKGTAYICAALVAFHPLLVKLSASIYNESVYLTLLMAAIYWGIRALDLRSPRDALLTGACLGLAYLSRPEAFAYPVFFALALCVAGLVRNRLRVAALGSALMLGAFLVPASPYIAFLYEQTGHFRMEGKWNINYTIAQRELSGMNFTEAAYGVGSDLKADGPLLVPSEFADYTPFPHALPDKVRTMLLMAKAHKETVYGWFCSPAFGSPALLALVVLGLFRTSWSSRRIWQEAVLIVMAASIVSLLLTATSISFRYLFQLLPLLLLWAGKGLEELGHWPDRQPALSSGLPQQSMPMSAALQVCAGLLMIGFSAFGTRYEYEFVMEQADHSATRDAGIWLRNHRPGPKRVAAWQTIVPYYAEATLVQFPFADPELTRRYLDLKQVDFVVLESQYSNAMPTIGEWIAHGIPDAHAHLIYDNGTASGNRVLIYCWQQHLNVTQTSSPDWHKAARLAPQASEQAADRYIQE